jgi:hypothetical protein
MRALLPAHSSDLRDLGVLVVPSLGLFKIDVRYHVEPMAG